MPPNARPSAVPVALWAVIGVFAASALITVLTSLGSGVVGAPILGIGVGLALIALQLYLGSRLARALAVVAAALLFVLSVSTGWLVWWILVGVALAAAAPVLTLAPSVRAYFAGPFGKVPATAVSVTLVQIVACIVGGVLLVGSLLMFVMGLAVVGGGASLGSSNEFSGALGGLLNMFGGVVVGFAVVYAGLAAFWLWAARALVRGSRGTRIAVTVVSGLNALPLFGLLLDAPGLVLTVLVLHGAVVGALWLPSDARRLFADNEPVALVEQWHQRALAFGASVTASASAGPTPVTPSPGPVRHSPPQGARVVGSPAPWSAAGPPSFPMPSQRVEEDPLTEPIALGRHARRDAGPAQPV